MAVLDKEAAIDLGMTDPDAGAKARSAISSAIRSAEKVVAKKAQGKPWRCSRVKKDVTMDYCVQRYLEDSKDKFDEVDLCS